MLWPYAVAGAAYFLFRPAIGYKHGRPRVIFLKSIGEGQFLSLPVAGRYLAMKAAARRDSIFLIATSGYRSFAAQAVLYAKHLAAGIARGQLEPFPPTAKPGYSNHNAGEAVDVKLQSGVFDWLSRNAVNYGFHNFPPEPWHWSLDGR